MLTLVIISRRKCSDPLLSLSRALVMNHRYNYRTQQQTANQNDASVCEREKYKTPDLP